MVDGKDAGGRNPCDAAVETGSSGWGVESSETE